MAASRRDLLNMIFIGSLQQISLLMGPFYFGIVGALLLRKGMEGVGSVLSARGLAMT